MAGLQLSGRTSFSWLVTNPQLRGLRFVGLTRSRRPRQESRQLYIDSGR